MNRGEIRPFSKPWKLVDHEESFEVHGLGRPVAGLHLFSDDANRRNFMRRLSKDDARRMAQQILRLPEFVRIARGIDPNEPE